MQGFIFLFQFWIILLPATIGLPQQTSEGRTHGEPYLSWNAKQATEIGKRMRAKGWVGGNSGFRITSRDQAIGYKLRVTWLTPDVIRATARLEQLKNRLTNEQTQALVSEAEAAGHTAFLIEIDPNEGSGVIPLDWRVFLQPKGLKFGSEGAIPGVKAPQLRNVKALAGVMRRDYNYDVFWVTFPLVDDQKQSILPDSVQELELVVGIYGKEGRASWQIPSSVRQHIQKLMNP